MIQNNMKTAISILVLTFILASGSVYAKSENSNQGNSGSGSSGGGNSGSNSSASVGNVEDIKPDKITIEEKKTNKKVEASVDNDTEIIHQNKGPSLNKGKGSINSIKKDDTVAVVSTQSASEHKGKLGKALKIFVKEATSSGQSKRRAIQGVVLSINGTILNIAHQIHRDRTNTVFTDSSTIFKIKGIENGSLANVQVGNRIAAVGEATEGGILAKRVHVIPGKATGIFRRLPVATLSATPSATPEATSSGVEGATVDAISNFLNNILRLLSITK